MDGAVPRRRLDAELAARGLVRSRSQARACLDAGWVRVNGRTITKGSTLVGDADEVTLAQRDPYVSRAAHKLLGALADTGLRPSGRALDAGASTGGFTQVLLESGCAPVYAVDVGHGQLAPTLAADPRVRVREGVNLRDLTRADLDEEPVDWVVADVSFISLRLLLAPLLDALRPGGAALLLVKPQFEVGRQRLGRGGVVRDAARRDEAVAAVAALAADLGHPPTWSGPSRLPGQDGNIEHFLLLGAPPHGGSRVV
ncbi:TlyA family RNA methyltransferase [Propionicicella superfundia]|uniref:TlyA family RNA methyltransferase n=1 Tax=Propionicicella superfundia TaxID=348582 RepID=UPI000563DA03|nr:TlyA family RNA methyltransferase [Propionicicella superfundia]